VPGTEFEGHWVPLCKRRLKISLREHPTLRDLEALKNLQIGNRLHNDIKNTDLRLFYQYDFNRHSGDRPHPKQQCKECDGWHQSA